MVFLSLLLTRQQVTGVTGWSNLSQRPDWPQNIHTSHCTLYTAHCTLHTVHTALCCTFFHTAQYCTQKYIFSAAATLLHSASHLLEKSEWCSFSRPIPSQESFAGKQASTTANTTLCQKFPTPWTTQNSQFQISASKMGDELANLNRIEQFIKHHRCWTQNFQLNLTVKS